MSTFRTRNKSHFVAPDLGEHEGIYPLVLLRIFRTIAVLLVIMACRHLSAAADAGSYAFVDESGTAHLSNVPDDERFERLEPLFPEANPPAAAPARKPAADPMPGGALRAMVEQVAGQFGVDAALLHAVISVESGYNPRAVSKAGAAGLMQLMPATARRFGVADVFDPSDNVRGGARYLAELLNLFGNDLQLALAAYNAGENAVLRYGKRIPPYPETVAYVPKVVDYYRKFQAAM
jgi:soluble lytic murein transglycosylase-like protein